MTHLVSINRAAGNPIVTPTQDMTIGIFYLTSEVTERMDRGYFWRELSVTNDQFLALGLEPTTLSQGLVEETLEIGQKYASRADVTKIIARSVWTAGMETSPDLMAQAPTVTGASRAVGMANNRNPISIFIPCHRVIGSNGKLVGYLGGLDLKERLLELEKRNCRKTMD